MPRTEDINRDTDEIKHDSRHVEHVVGPVAPAGQKSVEVAEDFFGPEIHSAFTGITVCEFNYREALRPEEKKKRDDPKPNGDTTVGGDRGNDVEIEDRNYEQQYEIAASESTDQMRLGFGLCGRTHCRDQGRDQRLGN